MLADQKQLIRKEDVSYIEVPHYDELSVKQLWPQFNGDDLLVRYFPDEYPKDKGPPREYFFNILNTLYPDFLAQILEHANKQRMTTEGEAQKEQSIKISQYWEEQLKAMPYLSCKCHLHLSYILVHNSASVKFISNLSPIWYREGRQDDPPAEGKIEADPERQEEEEGV